MQYFVDVMVQWQVVNYLMMNDVVGVDQEGVVQCYVFVWMFNIVSFLDFMFDVSNYCVFNWVDIVLVYWGVMLCVVYEFGVEGNVNYFYVVFLEFFVMFVECDQFRWVYEGEVYWLEEQNGRFIVGVLFEIEFFNDFIIIQYSGCSKIWCLMSDQNYLIFL